MVYLKVSGFADKVSLIGFSFKNSGKGKLIPRTALCFVMH